MLWQRTAQTQAPSLAPLVPDGEAVRLSALQASWRRDRRVAQRRIALRWLAWIGWRYGLPVLGVLAALALVWRIFLGSSTGAAVEIPALSVAPSPAPVPTSVAQDHPPVKLHLDPVWPGAPATPPHPVPSPIPAAPNPDAITTPYTPHLKPENWLHSKEP